MAKTPVRAKGAPEPTGKVPPVRKNKQYGTRLARTICDRLAGGEVWSRIAGVDDMPSQSTLYQWMKAHPDFREAVNEAREIAADRAADDVLMTARGVTAATATADRVRMSGLQWSAAKAAPHRYGAKAEGRAAEPVRLVIRVRHFEEVIGPDGRRSVREIKPDGQS